MQKRAVFLPQTLDIRGNATTKVLHRSIYDVAVYTSVLDFTGSFAAPDMSEVATDVRERALAGCGRGAGDQRRLRPENDGLPARR